MGMMMKMEMMMKMKMVMRMVRIYNCFIYKKSFKRSDYIAFIYIDFFYCFYSPQSLKKYVLLFVFFFMHFCCSNDFNFNLMDYLETSSLHFLLRWFNADQCISIF